MLQRNYTHMWGLGIMAVHYIAGDFSMTVRYRDPLRCSTCHQPHSPSDACFGPYAPRS